MDWTGLSEEGPDQVKKDRIRTKSSEKELEGPDRVKKDRIE